MSFRQLQLSLFALLMLALAGCSQVNIDHPEKNGVYPEPPNIELSFQGGSPSALKVELNNQEITDLLTVTDTGASVAGSLLTDYMAPGTNLLYVNSGTSGKSLLFTYDVEGPDVHVLSVVENSPLEVSGHLVDPSGVTSFSINGNNVALSGSNPNSKDFNALVTSSPSYELVTEDSYGHVSTSKLARRDMQFNTSVGARISNGGIDLLIDALVNAIDSEAIHQKIQETQNNKGGYLLEEKLLGLIWLRLSETDLSWSDLDVQFDVINAENRFDIDVDIDDFVVGADFETADLFKFFWIKWPGGTITMPQFNFSTDAILTIQNHNLTVDLTNTNIDVPDIYIDSDFLTNVPIIGGVIDAIVTLIGNLFLDIFVPPVELIIDGILDQLITDFYSDLHIRGTSTINGEVIYTNIVPETLLTDSGGVLFEMGGYNYAEIVTKPTLGSHYVEDVELPVMPVTTPGGASYDIGAVISSNYMNQAMLAAHESGLSTVTLDFGQNGSLSYDGLEVIKGDEDEIEPGDTFRIILDPASPAFFDLIGSTTTMGNMGMNDVYFGLARKKAGEADYTLLFGSTVDIEIAFDLGVIDGPDGTKYLDIGLPSVPVINVIDIADEGVIHLSENFVNRAMRYLIPIVLPPIAKKLSSLPVPQIGGYGILPEEFWLPGAGNTHIALAGSLIKIEVTEQAPEPTTTVTMQGGSTALFTASSKVVTTASDTDVNTAPEVNIINGEVTLNFSGSNPSTGSLQYRYRLDNGEWSTWQTRNQVTLYNLLGGDHTVEVCSRTALLKEDTSCATQTFNTHL